MDENRIGRVMDNYTQKINNICDDVISQIGLSVVLISVVLIYIL